MSEYVDVIVTNQSTREQEVKTVPVRDEVGRPFLGDPGEKAKHTRLVALLEQNLEEGKDLFTDYRAKVRQVNREFKEVNDENKRE